MDREAKFLQHNRLVIARLRSFDDRLRQPDVLISDRALFDFYAHRVPAPVCDVASFEGWVRQLDGADIDDLSLDEESILGEKLDQDINGLYPDSLEIGGHRFSLRYRFAPGEPDDGITAIVPSELLGELDQRSFDRLVPGYLEEKVQALLRALPKSLRREVVPLNEFCARFVEEAGQPGGALTEALAAHARRMRGVDIPSAAWHADRLPDHLRMRYSIVGADDDEIASGRNLIELQRRLAGGERSMSALSGGLERAGLTDWGVGDIEDEVSVRRDNRDAVVYPMLEDRGDCVWLTASESRERARELHRQGVRRLFLLTRQRDLQRLKKNLPGIERLELAYSAVHAAPPAWQSKNGFEEESAGFVLGMADQIVQSAVAASMGEAGFEVRKESEFRAASEHLVSVLPALASELCALCEEILHRHRRIRRDLDENPPPARAESINDIRLHLDTLVYRSFILATPLEHLRNYPRYLDALERRIGKIRLGGSKDGDKVQGLTPLWERFVVRSMDHLARGRSDPERERYRWMLEEYRVSLFAQELGTVQPVSQKRLDNQWAKVSP
jgi:ATP-dependent helicase HrpA